MVDFANEGIKRLGGCFIVAWRNPEKGSSSFYYRTWQNEEFQMNYVYSEREAMR